MKRPSRMRMKNNPTKMDSSAFEVSTICSDSIDIPYGKRLSNNGLVSAKYNRTVQFTIPEKDKLKLKDINNAAKINGIKKDSAVIVENAEKSYGYNSDLGRRRMSAPELPPIPNIGKSSTLISNGYITSRSNTFHRLTLKPGKSIHSDSSVSGYRLNSQSRTSSSSSQKSKGRVLSAGTDRRSNKQIITADFSKNIQELVSGGKQDSPEMRNGASTAVTQRCPSVSGLGRQKSKYSLKEQSTPRGLPKSRSEAQLTRRRGSIDALEGLPRNYSERSLTESKKNANNSQNNKVTSQKKFKLNGLRQYASSNALNIDKGEKGNEPEDPYIDSDTDSDKDQRVLNWIIGVNEVAEPPEEPTIEHEDEPPQRDTAIRIVYDGDS